MDSPRQFFPLLQKPGLVYLDSAATSQKPQVVIDAVSSFYTTQNSNIHRGVYGLSQEATEMYDAVREKVARFMHAESAENIVFTRSATESLNLLANTITLQPGDIVLVSGMEHHANIVPWHMACARSGAELKAIPLTDQGEVDLEAYKEMLSPRVRVVACTHVSNVLGTINPIAKIIDLAHKYNALSIIDGSQAIMHMPIDVRTLGADAYVWTGHKCYGPTGTGVLYMTKALMRTLPPWQGGGDMIESVSFERVTYQEGPQRFEAGTPNIAGIVGLGAALDFLTSFAWEDLQAQELTIKNYAEQRLREVPGLHLLGHQRSRAPIFSFTLKGVHAHDVGTVLDTKGVCVRTGQHCAEPLLQRYGVAATTRISCGMYTTTSDIDAAIDALYATITMFR